MAKRMGGFVRCWCALLACHAAAALAQTDALPPLANPPELPASAEARLEALETQLQQLQTTQPPPAVAAAPEPTLEIGGLVQIDYLWIGQDMANRLTVGDANDTFAIRRARLTASGEVAEVASYAIGFDFALAGRPTFLDNWVAVGELPVLGNVRAGHFFEPFSLERLTLVRYTTFLERSLADALAPARNIGLMAHSTIGQSQRGTWAIGWFRSDSDVFGDDTGDNGGWAITGRATWLPLYDETDLGRTLLHVGAAFSARTDDDGQMQFSSFPEGRAGSPRADGIPPFVDTGTFAADNDQRFGLEAAIVRGPWYGQAEYMALVATQPSGDRLYFHGAYAFVSYFLTGEHRTYDKQRGTFDRVYPYENFFRVRTSDGPVTGRGAWEIAARWSLLDLDSAPVRGGTLNELTLGLHWHLNPYTRIKWEYVYSMLDRAPLGDSSAHIAGMRFDIDF